MKANDVDLIRRVLDGDQDAFTALVDKYQKSVHALIWRKIGDFHIAEVARVKPASPPVSRPWLPWGLSFVLTLLVILMIGTEARALSRFQQPYNLGAISEMTIELVDTPIVEVSARKSDTRTRFGISDTHDKSSGAGFQSETLRLAAAQVEETDLPATKPQWVQTKGPGGVSRAGLFLTSDQTLYAIAKTGLYRLSETEDAWTFVGASGPNREFNPGFNPVMAERDGTLYLLTSNELLVSVDDGKVWNSLGKRPEGRAVTLIVTDLAMYLILQTEVFRSEDVGQQWEPIGQTLQADNLPEAGNPNFHIWDALAIDNTLFLGTSQGLFRFTDEWKKLPVPTSHGIKSLAVTGDRLYVGTTNSPQRGIGRSMYAAVFYSTDLGDSWTDITPDTREHLRKIIAAVEVVPVGDTLMLVGVGGVLSSYDRGETWINPKRDRRVLGAFPVVAVDESNFYVTNPSGIIRSTNGGATWHPFMTGLVNSRVSELVTVKNVLYARTREEMYKSADGGETWESVGLSIDKNASWNQVGVNAKIATSNGVLYTSNSKFDGVALFRLSDAGDMFLPLEGVPVFEEDTLYMERWQKSIEATKNNIDIDKVQELLKTNQVDKIQALLTANQPRMLEELRANGGLTFNVLEEFRTNGTFTVANDTVFMEYKHKLFRWRRGETAWHYTGLEDQGGISPIEGKGFTLAVSGSTVYAGKRDGELFLSIDGGDTWREITENPAFPFGHFKEILFADAAVYVSTDMGVMRSRGGEVWEVVTDIDGNRLIMDRIAIDGVLVYGVCDSGIYEVDSQTNAWKRITAELPHTATAFAVEGRTFYIGTKQNGVFRFQRDDP